MVSFSTILFKTSHRTDRRRQLRTGPGRTPLAFMTFHRQLLALFLAGFMAFAHAAPETMPDGEADPIARFASPGEEAAGDLLLQAMSLIGVAYRFGGNSPETGLDCSGFIQYVFKKSLRVTLPRTSAGMAQVGREIERDELKAGDLVFFNTRGFRYSHVGIYLGNNKFIHAPRTGKNIEVANMGNSYWAGRYNGARRVSRTGLPVAAAEADKPVSSALAEKRSSKSRKAEAAARETREAKGKKRKASREPAVKSRKARQAEQGRKKSSRSEQAAKKSSKKAAEKKKTSKPKQKD